MQRNDVLISVLFSTILQIFTSKSFLITTVCFAFCVVSLSPLVSRAQEIGGVGPHKLLAG